MEYDKGLAIECAKEFNERMDKLYDSVEDIRSALSPTLSSAKKR